MVYLIWLANLILIDKECYWLCLSLDITSSKDGAEKILANWLSRDYNSAHDIVIFTWVSNIAHDVVIVHMK